MTGLPEGWLKSAPMERIVSPDVIAPGALYLVSDDASFVTGTTLVMDGGFLAI